MSVVINLILEQENQQPILTDPTLGAIYRQYFLTGTGWQNTQAAGTNYADIFAPAADALRAQASLPAYQSVHVTACDPAVETAGLNYIYGMRPGACPWDGPVSS